ncbi:MAG: hypothetical protein II956_16640 [Bacteroidales bacterium]|nr:hypothetical protein [Bacteroidales bacterium]
MKNYSKTYPITLPEGNEPLVIVIFVLFLKCCNTEEYTNSETTKLIRYLLSKNIINRKNFKNCNSNGYAAMTCEDFFNRFHQQPKPIQTELIRIMNEYVGTLTIDEINDILVNANDHFALKEFVKNLDVNGKKRIIQFFNKCGILIRINDILLYQIQINPVEIVLKDVQILSNLIDKPEKDLVNLQNKLDYYCNIIDKEKLKGHSLELQDILNKILGKPQFINLIDTVLSEKNDRGSTSADKMTKLLSVTVNDKSKLEPILEFCQFAVEKGYYSDNLPLLFTECLNMTDKILYNESNRIAHFYFFKRIKQYSNTDNLENIFTTLFIKTKGKSKGNTISLKLGGNEGNEDKRTKDFKSELDRLLPEI